MTPDAWMFELLKQYQQASGFTTLSKRESARIRFKRSAKGLLSGKENSR